MNLFKYFSDAREELSRVTWPTRTEVLEGTQATLIFLVALTLIIWLMDTLFGTAIHTLLK